MHSYYKNKMKIILNLLSEESHAYESQNKEPHGGHPHIFKTPPNIRVRALLRLFLFRNQQGLMQLFIFRVHCVPGASPRINLVSICLGKWILVLSILFIAR